MKGRTNAGGGGDGKESVWVKALRFRAYNDRAWRKDGLVSIGTSDFDELLADMHGSSYTYKYMMPSYMLSGVRLESLTIPDSVQINDYALESICGDYKTSSSGTHQTMPCNLKFEGSNYYLGYGVFSAAYLSKWPEGICPTSFTSYMFQNVNIVGSSIFEVPEGVEDISGYQSLTPSFWSDDPDSDNFGRRTEGTLVLPSTITNLNQSFNLVTSENKDLITIDIRATTPPTINSNTFYYGVKKIIVPVGCLEAYQTATNWAKWADVMEEATE